MTYTEKKEMLADGANYTADASLKFFGLFSELSGAEVDGAVEELSKVLIAKAEEWCAAKAAKLEETNLELIGA